MRMQANYETIFVKESRIGLFVKLNRPDQRNSLNTIMINELINVLDIAEQQPEWKLIILEGQSGVFCTGMDLDEYTSKEVSENESSASQSSKYLDLVKRLSLIPKIIVSCVDGEVTAGGVGLVAASDMVIASPRSAFSLSEALWGLLPAIVTPYLIRRIGYRKAYQMTLTTMQISAQEAYDIQLVDELSDSLENSVRKLWLRLRRLEESTIGNIKSYFRKMWIINEQMESEASEEISKLMADSIVQRNINNYVKYGKFPWESLNK